MSQQTCSMRELCIRLLALAVAGRAQQGHLQQQDAQQPQEQQQDGQQRRSLSPEVRVNVGVEAVAQRLRESFALTKRMAAHKLMPKDLELANQASRSIQAHYTKLCQKHNQSMQQATGTPEQQLRARALGQGRW